MRLTILATTCLALALGGPALEAQQYLTFPGWATAVTPDGAVVVGNLLSGAFSWRWQQDPAPVPIGGLSATAVSDDGTVITGNMADPTTGAQVAGRWTAATGWVPLGGISQCGSISSAYDISADGKQVVGLVWVGCSARGFRWTEGVGIEVLENLANGNNRCSTISADGSVMGGFAQGTFDRTPAVWSADTSGVLWNVNSLGEVLGLDDSGDVMVGTYVFGSGANTTAFLRSTAAGLVNLGSLQSGWNSSAYDISEDGQLVVGFDHTGFARKAWVWRPGSGLTAMQTYLTSLGIPGVPALEVALACSDSGRTIVGGGSFKAYIASTAPEAWTRLADGVPGSDGPPVLFGTGPLTPGSTAHVSLTHGKALGTAAMVVGLGAANVPFKQGVLVPTPDSVLFGLPLDADGALQGQFTWPAGLPAGTSVWWQAWIADPAAPAGYASSNGLKSTTP